MNGVLDMIPNVPFNVCAKWNMSMDGENEHITGLDALVRKAEREAADRETARAGAGGRVHPQADDGGAAPQLEARETTRAEAPKNSL